MNCLDCTLTGKTTPAVATCHSCGAAVCADHAVIQPHHLHRTVPLNRLIPVEPPARVITCTVCAAAENALWSLRHPEPVRRPWFTHRHPHATTAAEPTAPGRDDFQRASRLDGTHVDVADAASRHP